MNKGIRTGGSSISWATSLLPSDRFNSFLVEFVLHNIGNLIETVAALVVASISKSTRVGEQL